MEIKLEQARRSGLLHLAQKHLERVPRGLFRADFSSLYRLDLGFNLLTTLPDSIGQLSGLVELWLNDNPLDSLPPSLCKCAQLRVLDLNRTDLTDLPCELGRLEFLVVLEMDEVPLRPKLQSAAMADTDKICANTLTYLRRKDVRRALKQTLLDKLRDGIYLESADSNQGVEMIQTLMKHVLKEFRTEDEVKGLIRHADRLFPQDLAKAHQPTATAAAVRASYLEIKSENDKKKLAADLELKIRNIYFDRIDVSKVEPMVASIYSEIKSLQDIKFLLRYATQLFPPSAADVDGPTLRQKLKDLQDDMARERAATVEKVVHAVASIYSDVEPDKIHALVAQVAPLFKNVRDLKTLAADAALHFPTEFLNASAAEIRASFVRKSSANLPKISHLSTSESSGEMADEETRDETTASNVSSNESSEQEYILKVVLIGDSGVGKSNLVQRFTKNKYNGASTQTIGFEFAAKTIRVGDRRIKAQIWDTAGQERFQSLTAAYYRNAVGALVVYDITNRHSFEHVTHWLEQIREHAHENVVLILVGNKCDLAHLPNTRQVSTLEAARFAETHHMEFVEASALDSTNVVEAFKRIIVPVGRLLTPMPSAASQTQRLPPGWRRVLSRTRPGEYSYENQYTKERLAFAPKEAAKPSQYSFQAGHGIYGSVGATVTKETLERQHQKAFYAQNSASSNCFSGVCGLCTIL
ncbi:unnamed protein product [Aphanomyces euteiches]